MRNSTRNSMQIPNLMIVVILASIAILLPNTARSEKEDPADAQKFREITNALLAHLENKEQLLNLLKNAQVSVEAYRVIEADLNKRIPKDWKPPKMALKNGEVRIDGKATGLRVLSHAPLKLVYRSRTWVYNVDKTTDDNYLALIKFLEKSTPRTTSSIMDLFLPKAHAFGWAAMASTFGAMSTVLGSMAFNYQRMASMYYYNNVGYNALYTYRPMPTAPAYYQPYVYPTAYPMYPGYPASYPTGVPMIR